MIMALSIPQNVLRRREVLPCNTADTFGRRHYGRSPIRALSVANLANRQKLDVMNAVDVSVPPQDLGRLWYDDEIPRHFFSGRVSVRWVREHLPRGKGLKIGRGWAWYERDVTEWIASRRGAGKATA
jgi:hypothetical protein